MVFLYNALLFLVSKLFVLASLVHRKAKLFVEGRRDVISRIQQAFTTNTSKVVWVHCASLGEFEQGRPLIEKLKQEFPDHKILLTFFSPSGYEVRKNYALADWVFYLPWDTQKNAIAFLNAAKPVLAVFVKYEFWYHYATQLKKRSITTLSIASIFRPEQLFFKSYGSFYSGILKKFSYFFVQNYASADLLKRLGINAVSVAGDTRFDRVVEIAGKAESILLVEAFKAGEKVMVVGSAWPEDMEVLFSFINEQGKHLKFIIAPHEIDEANLVEIEQGIQQRYIRFSKANEESVKDYSVLIIDNIGMLSRLYRYGEFAYVGGAFGKGLHNILEAACYGIPVFFGKKSYQKFQEAKDLINRGGAFEVADYSDLLTKYETVTAPENFLMACEVTKAYVHENLGATDKIMDYCRNLLRA